MDKYIKISEIDFIRLFIYLQILVILEFFENFRIFGFFETLEIYRFF